MRISLVISYAATTHWLLTIQTEREVLKKFANTTIGRINFIAQYVPPTEFNPDFYAEKTTVSGILLSGYYA